MPSSGETAVQPERLLDDLPAVAILRGVSPDNVAAVSEALYDAGIRAIEVPLNSPEPYRSIEQLSRTFGDRCLCGAGTVLSAEDAQRAHDAGARVIVSPNTDAAVIARTVALGMVSMPGFATATEAFAAIAAGATRLKLFPASTYGAGHAKALKAVLPTGTRLYAVGGIGVNHVAEWMSAGVAGFGFGSELFKPDYSLGEIAKRANEIVRAVRGAMSDR
jgi:2-dehydro-3-deoxyphosphogalactonate aldolase